MPLKIAITGPESTGKSVLARDLAGHYHTDWIPEYARGFLDSLSRPYHYDDILHIAKQQVNSINNATKINSAKFLFCDTELTVIKIWCKYKYGRCHPWILERHKEQVFDLYLLTDIDLPWQPDPLREHPDRRQELFDLYKKELGKQQWPFEIVGGSGQSRLQNAIRIIEERL